MDKGFVISNDEDLISRLDAWTLRLYSIQHFDEAVKSFCGEVYEGLQCRSVIFFKYLKNYGSLIATNSEGVNFDDIRGIGLNFSQDSSFSAVRDFIRIGQNTTFNEIMSKVSPNHNYITSLCVVRGEVKGLFVYTDIEAHKLELSYYKVAERLFSHWASEIFLIESNHNLSRYDELTELLNKKVFTEYVLLEVGRAQRIKHPVSLVALRLDHAADLKTSLNSDRYSALMRMIGKILIQATRKTDYVGAFSEGEFGVLLPHMSLKNARNKARQLKNTLESAKYFSDSNLNLNSDVQFSICISEYPSLAYDFEDFQLSTFQRLMIEPHTGQIVETIKREDFVPDFIYSEIESKK